jgi:hypothetical protein
VAQVAGALAATALFRFLMPARSPKVESPIVDTAAKETA